MNQQQFNKRSIRGAYKAAFDYDDYNEDNAIGVTDLSADYCFVNFKNPKVFTLNWNNNHHHQQNHQQKKDNNNKNETKSTFFNNTSSLVALSQLISSSSASHSSSISTSSTNAAAIISSSTSSTSTSNPFYNVNSYFKKKCEDYTLAGRTEQQSRFSKHYYHQVGTFLTQYKIRENYKFLQMISVPPLDPTVPKPEGSVSVPACGEPLLVPQSFPQSIEAAIHKFANASSKATCITVLDHNGKANASLTYGK